MNLRTLVGALLVVLAAVQSVALTVYLISNRTVYSEELPAPATGPLTTPSPTVTDGNVASALRMPNVEGLTVERGREILESIGIDPSRVSVEHAPAAGAAGIILDQFPVGGDQAGSEKVSLVVSEPAVTPDLVGMTRGESLGVLATLGARPVYRLTYEAGIEAGTVVSHDPEDGSPLSQIVTVVIAAEAMELPLELLPTVARTFCADASDVRAGGTDFPTALRCNPSLRSPTFAEYDVGRDFERLRTTVGLSDDADDTTVVVRFLVFDGPDEMSRVEVGFGDTQEIDVDLTGVLRLRLEAQIVSAESALDRHSIIWGMPVLVGSPFYDDSNSP